MSQMILSHTREIDNPPFDPTMTVDARFAGGTITLEPRREDWLGETLVKIDMPGLTSPLMLRTYEARDLAQALQNVAQYIDEEAGR